MDSSTKRATDRETVFKRCTLCDFRWNSREDFLRDPHVRIIGYQAHFRELTAGLFFFNHSCRGTIAIAAGAFRDLYDGPIFTERATGSEQCPGHCLQREKLDPCPARCECAYIRAIVQIIRSYHTRKPDGGCGGTAP